MNNFKKKTIIVLFILTLMTANIVMFAQTVSLSDQMVNMETETVRLKVDNQKLEQKLYYLNSLTRIDKVSEYLGFTQTAQVLELTPLQYAMKP